MASVEEKGGPTSHNALSVDQTALMLPIRSYRLGKHHFYLHELIR